MKHSPVEFLGIFFLAACLGGLASPLPAAPSDWRVSSTTDIGVPGGGIDFRLGDRLAARLVHGPGQMKPFLHVYGFAGELLTNGGLDAAGQNVGLNFNHRGIFIGWNKLTADVGVFDLWHMNTYGRTGGVMELTQIEKMEGGMQAGRAVARIEWRGDRKDGSGSDLLISETRRIEIAAPRPREWLIDAHFTLKAERDVALNGDLQHAGVDFRASNDMVADKSKVQFLWEPDHASGAGKVVGRDLKWGLMLFPLGGKCFSVLQMSAPGTPVEELSWRDYGRIGFFFSRSLRRGESLDLDYRFIVRETALPAGEAERQRLRQECNRIYAAYAAGHAGSHFMTVKNHP